MDQSPSWGIFQRDGRWFWKDHGTGESGDEIAFILRSRNLGGKKNPHARAVAYWSRIADVADPTEVPAVTSIQLSREKPDRQGFHAGTPDQILRLSKLRDISVGALELASQSGVLIFGSFIGHEVFGVTDSSGNALEVRRLDGQPFAASAGLAERKSHALKGSSKYWPVGIANAGDHQTVLLVEGLPDLLAAFELVVTEEAQSWAAPVGMLSASARIGDEALMAFAGKRVRIVAHRDPSGEAAVQRWADQLRMAGVAGLEVISLGNTDGRGEPAIKDLNDYLPIYRAEKAAGSPEWRLLS